MSSRNDGRTLGSPRTVLWGPRVISRRVQQFHLRAAALAPDLYLDITHARSSIIGCSRRYETRGR